MSPEQMGLAVPWFEESQIESWIWRLAWNVHDREYAGSITNADNHRQPRSVGWCAGQDSEVSLSLFLRIVVMVVVVAIPFVLRMVTLPVLPEPVNFRN